MNGCGVVHVIDNEDFGRTDTAPKHTGVKRRQGTCERCLRDGTVRRCDRCGAWFCEGAR